MQNIVECNSVMNLLLIPVLAISCVSSQLLPISLSESCRPQLKADAIVCIDNSTLEWKADLKKEPFDGKTCCALWDVMCCINRSKNIDNCSHEDIKILEDNFDAIQQRLENTDCKHNLRNSVKCH